VSESFVEWVKDSTIEQWQYYDESGQQPLIRKQKVKKSLDEAAHEKRGVSR
jgi:hypothetical protein